MSIRKELIESITQNSRNPISKLDLIEMAGMSLSELIRKSIKITYSLKYPIKTDSK